MRIAVVVMGLCAVMCAGNALAADRIPVDHSEQLRSVPVTAYRSAMAAGQTVQVPVAARIAMSERLDHVMQASRKDALSMMAEHSAARPAPVVVGAGTNCGNW